MIFSDRANIRNVGFIFTGSNPRYVMLKTSRLLLSRRGENWSLPTPTLLPSNHNYRSCAAVFFSLIGNMA